MTNVLKSKIAKAGLGLLVAVMAFSGATTTKAMTQTEAQTLISILGLTGAQAQAVLALATPTTGGTTSGSCYTFAAPNLSVGSSSEAVMQLQKVLNSNSATALAVAAGSNGSAGHETTYFGGATKTALVKFQAWKNISPTSGTVGPLTRSVLNAMCVPGTPVTTTPGTTTQTGPVTAMLAIDNPASGTLVATQATADLAHFAFNGTGVVTQVTLQRIGVSADATLSNVYLFDGATRLTDAASVTNNGMVTFSNPSGLFTVGGSKTISVKSDILTGTSGQTVGIKLVSFMTSGATTAVTAGVSGNVHSIATATLAAVSAGTVTPTGATINPGSNVTLWQSTLNISNRDVMLKRLALRQVGSAPASSFQNFKLYVNGVQVGTATGIDSMGYVTFNMMATPVTLTSGSRVVRVDADVVSGASRTVQLSVRQAADLDLVDTNYGVNITPTGTPWTAATALTISGTSGGTLTIDKDVSSPSTTVTLAGNDVNLGTFKVTAFGEPIKIETLTAGFTFTDGGTSNAAATLRNGRLLINGVQYGSTATLVPAGTAFSTNYTVMPGTPVMVEIHADVYDNDGTGSLDSSDTLMAKIIAGSSNAMRVDSLGSFSAPSSAVNANTVSVASAQITLSKNTTYANQSTALPATNFKIGSWNLSGSSVEDVLLTTLSFDVTESTGTEFDEGDITNMYVVVKNSAGTIVAQPSPIATLGTGADQNFSVNYTLAKNSSLTFELYANLADDGLDMVAGVSGGSDAIDNTDAFQMIFMVSGTSLVSGQAVTSGNGTSTIAGQAIAKGAASITASADSSTPVAGIVYDNQTVTSAAFKFAAVTSAYDVTAVTLTIADATAVNNVMLYDGSTLVATQPGGTTVTFSGLTWRIPANTTNKVLTVKLDLGTIGVGAGTTGASLVTAISAFTASSVSTGVSATGTGTPTGLGLNVFASIPSVSQVALTSNTLTNGTARPLFRFKMDANGGSIAWDMLTFKVNKDGTTTVGTNGTTGIKLWDVTGGGNTEVLGTFTNGAQVYGALSSCATVTCDIKFVPTSEETVSSTKTYELRGNVASATTDAFVSVTIDNDSSSVVASDTAANIITADGDAPIVWSDMSAASHAVGTADWTSDFGIRNLPVSDTLNY